jgi:hypothetical protein
MSGKPAWLSALFAIFVLAASTVPALGASATFLPIDTTTTGNWKGVYGQDGAILPNDASNPASYAIVSTTGTAFTWVPTTPDTRALLKTSSLTDRIASAYYSDTVYTIDVNITDSQTHQVALYAMDWEGTDRNETIKVKDPGNNNAVLSTVNLSNFHSGMYLAWNVAGHVVFEVTHNSGSSAVISGIFFGTGTPAAVSITSPAGGNVTGTLTLSATATAFTGVASVQFRLDGSSVTAPVTTAIAGLYSAQWDSGSSSTGTHLLTAVVTDTLGRTATSAPVSISTFNSGPAQPTATFIGTDTTALGNWKTKFGQDGYLIPNEPVLQPPTYATISSTSSSGGTVSAYAYIDGSQDTSLQKAMQWAGTPPATLSDKGIGNFGDNPPRNPSVFFDPTNVTIDLNLTDGQLHQVAIYAIDFDSTSRTETISILDGNNGQVLNSQAVSNFNAGVYYIWTLKGHVKIRFVNTNGASGSSLEYSGLFFGGGTPAPAVGFTSPAAGSSVSGMVTVTAHATSSVGVASLQFQLDGANLGSLITAPGPDYTIQWPANSVISGSHAFTATATDTLGQSSTSGITISVNNPPPSVSMTAPTPGNTVLGIIPVSATASSVSEQVVSVQFLLDGSAFGAPIAAPGPYTIQWDTNTAVNGPHTLAASALDTLGQIGSASVAITVSNGGPQVSITSPAPGPVTGTSVSVTATAAQVNAAVASVQFKLDGANLGGLIAAPGPYTTTFDPRTLSTGPHALTAVASDTLGQRTTSDPVSVTVSNPAPIVTMTGPAGGTTVIGTIAVSATASSPTVQIASVQFKVDGTNIGTAVAAPGPYTVQWASTGSTNGVHSLTAVAKDTLGQTTTSTPAVSVTINNPPPVVSITSPATGAPVSGTVSITVNATSTIGMASVQFQVDGANFGTPVTGAGSIFTKQWFTGPVANGLHTLTAIGFDTQNQQTTSQIVTVNVQNTPPTISITAPTGGTNVAGPITINATASSSTAQMASVQFKVDGANVGSLVNGTGPVFSTQWNSGTALNGQHILTAVATDTLGITTTSAGVSVTVANPPPTVSIISPTGAFALVQTVTVTANASSAIGLASVQFQLDGANLGALVTGSGTSFATPWLTTTAANGPHILTAIATDTQGQHSTSNGVTVNVSNGPPPPPSAVFVKTDSVTKGNWKTVYGGDGSIIPNDSTNIPGYATYVPTGANAFTWAPSSTDPRTLTKSASSTDRIASAFYTNSSFTYDVNLNDGQVHQLALYLLDYEGSSRAESISILNANTNAVLNSQTFSNFNGGVYALWSIQGHVIVQVNYQAGQSAVVSGVFFDTVVPPPPPPTVSIINPSAGTVGGSVTVTASASSSAGIGSVQFQLDGANLGAPVTTAVTGSYSIQWDTTTVVNASHILTAIATDTLNQSTTSAGLNVTTSNIVAPPTVSVTSPTGGTVLGTITLTATAGSTVGLTSVQFRLDGVNLGALQTGAGPTYSIQWNTLTASNQSHTLTAIATDKVNQQTTSSGVAVTVNNVAPAATFTKLDTTTMGTWKGAYGADGYIIPNDSTSPPSYATVVGPGTAGPAYTWNASTNDPRALQKSTSLTDRIASVFYTSATYSIDINFTDGLSHELAIYCLDLENSGRSQNISILNANTNAVLNTQAISNFSNGVYAVWNVQGHIVVQLNYVAGLNAGISGIFFKTNTPPPPPPSVSLTAPAANSTLLTMATLTAHALSNAGIASIQFKLDGANIGSPVTGAGPDYSMQWDTTTAANGPHTLTAVALDQVGQSTTSAGVAVTLNNNFTPPVVTITVPATNTTVAGAVTITATATAPAGMTSVQFKLDGANLGSIVNGSGPTFTLPWDTTTASNGPHVLTAVATDAEATPKTTTSANTNISVSNVGAAASFVKLDTTTKGSWKGVYGQEGSIIPNDATNVPTYAVISGPGAAGPAYTWIPSTSDIRALQKTASLTDRIASTYYSSSSFSFDVNLTDGLPHEMDLYFLDLENSPPRTETVSILDATSNAVLASQPMSNFSGGVYAVFNIQGHVVVKVTFTGGLNAVLSGLFFKTSAPPPTPPVISFSNPAPGATLAGTLNVSATATAAAGMASVQFKLDGTNLGPLVSGSGPYSTQWNTTTAANGSHTLTAVATDSVGQTTTATLTVSTLNTISAPVISITTPTGGTVSGIITATANATATAGMASVQFKLDGANLGTVTGAGPTYNLQWDTTTASNGSHTLTATATDAETIPQTTTASVTVSVVNVSASASFVKLDSTTQGNWKGVYGQDGSIIPADSSNVPGYAVITGPGAAGPIFTWSPSTTDVRALLKGTSTTDRIASTYYSSAGFTFDVNLTDALVHELDLYCLDLEGSTRMESISILNATTNSVLATKAMSNFNGGVYAVFNVQGHVLVKITYTGGLNAVLSGLFFKTNTPPPPAPTVSVTSPLNNASLSGTTSVTATATASTPATMASVQLKIDGTNVGSPVTGLGPNFTLPWNTAGVVSGSHAVTVVATDSLGQSTTSAAITVTTTNQTVFPTVSITAPAAGSVGGIVTVTANASSSAAAITSVQFKLDGANLGAPVTGIGPTYTMSWDSTTVSNGAHSLTAVATDAQPKSATSDPVAVTVANSGPSASFVKLDTTTKGNWKGVYGQDGSIIPNDSSNVPTYATITGPGAAGPSYTWVASTTDVRALLKGASLTDRIASTYYTNSSPNFFTFDVNLSDSQVHELDLYCFDLENSGRTETISILNASTNAVLASQPMSNFSGGVYAVFNVQGHVLVRVTFAGGGLNAVLSGLFFKTNTPPPPPPPAPTVSINSPLNNASLSGTTSVTATATAFSPATMASVQLQVDGTNVGSPVTGLGPNFTLPWNTGGASNGSHALTVVATDSLGQPTTSSPITVTTTNTTVHPTVSITAPAAGSVSGTVTVTANASSSAAAIASVQFKLDGASLGAPVTGIGPTYTMSWDSTTASNGAHSLTAVATDLQPQSTTSDPVAVTVANSGPSASFVKLDTATQGNWKGVYGQDGYIIPNDSNTLPTIVGLTNAGPTYTWSPSSTDVRALLKSASATDRIASTYYSNASFTFDVNLADTQVHELDLYCLDLENAGRTETITILNAATNAVLATQPMSNFSGGVYAVFNIQGHVLVRVTYTGGLNAVLSGLFLKTNAPAAPPPPAPVVNITAPLNNDSLGGTVTVTATATASSPATMASVQFKLDGANLGSAVTGSGPYNLSWNTASASNGSHILTAIATDSLGQPTTSAPISVTTTNSVTFPSVSITAPAAGPVSGGVTMTASATAAAGMSSVQFQVDGSNIGAAVTGSGPTFTQSWNSASSSNGSHTLTAIATDTLGHSTTSAGVIVNVANAAGTSVSFLKFDTTTQGSWKGVYGADGYIIPNDSNIQPTYATFGLGAGAAAYSWFPSTTDTRALVKGLSTTDRIASTFYSNSNSFTMDLNMNDGQLHQVALYAVDFDTNTRNETISVLDATTNAVLDTEPISNFHGGVWAVWNIQGHVIFQVTNASGGTPNVIVNGLFFRSFNGLLPPSVSITTPSGGTVGGPVTVTASATSAQGISSVQFQLDGVNLGSTVTNAGSLYTTHWASPASSNGVHTLTAIATDSLGLSSNSPGVNVTVSNGAPPAASAIFTSSDTTSAGNWVGLYGSDGYMMADGGASPGPAPSLPLVINNAPFYAQVNLDGALQFTWHDGFPASDNVGLFISPTSSTRIGAAYYQNYAYPNGGLPLLTDVNFADYQQHQLTLYFVDWHHNVRTQVVQILDPTTQAVLDTQTITNFDGGIYLKYNVQGHVQIKVTLIVTSDNLNNGSTPTSVVMAAMFFDPAH